MARREIPAIEPWYQSSIFVWIIFGLAIFESIISIIWLSDVDFVFQNWLLDYTLAKWVFKSLGWVLMLLAVYCFFKVEKRNITLINIIIIALASMAMISTRVPIILFFFIAYLLFRKMFEDQLSGFFWFLIGVSALLLSTGGLWVWDSFMRYEVISFIGFISSVVVRTSMVLLSLALFALILNLIVSIRQLKTPDFSRIGNGFAIVGSVLFLLIYVFLYLGLMGYYDGDYALERCTGREGFDCLDKASISSSKSVDPGILFVVKNTFGFPVQVRQKMVADRDCKNPQLVWIEGISDFPVVIPNGAKVRFFIKCDSINKGKFHSTMTFNLQDLDLNKSFSADVDIYGMTTQNSQGLNLTFEPLAVAPVCETEACRFNLASVTNDSSICLALTAKREQCVAFFKPKTNGPEDCIFADDKELCISRLLRTSGEIKLCENTLDPIECVSWQSEYTDNLNPGKCQGLYPPLKVQCEAITFGKLKDIEGCKNLKIDESPTTYNGTPLVDSWGGLIVGFVVLSQWRDFCFAKAADNSRNSSYCEPIESTETKLLCLIGTYGVIPPSICENAITAPTDAHFFSYYNHPIDYPIKAIDCWTQAAISNKEIALCTNVPDTDKEYGFYPQGTYRQNCIAGVAFALADRETCELISDADYKQYCYKEVVRAKLIKDYPR